MQEWFLPNAHLIAASHQSADIFAEMELFMVDSQQVDDSRESVYMRMDSE